MHSQMKRHYCHLIANDVYAEPKSLFQQRAFFLNPVNERAKMSAAPLHSDSWLELDWRKDQEP